MMKPVKTTLFLSALGVLAASGCECGDGGDLLEVAPHLAVDPVSLDFGEVGVGMEKGLVLRLTNDGKSPLLIRSGSVRSAGEQFRALAGPPTALSPQQSAMWNIAFAPLAPGEDSGTITIVADDKDGTRTIPIRGLGVVPGITVNLEGDRCGGNSDSIAFGVVAPGTRVERKITIEATGAVPATVLTAALDPSASGEWGISGLPEGGATIARGERLELVASYTPADSGEDTAAFIITTDVVNRRSIRVRACGSGAAPSLCAYPAPIDLGVVGLASTATRAFELENCGDQEITLSDVAIASDAAHPAAMGYAVENVSVALPKLLQVGERIRAGVRLTGTRLGTAQAWVRARSSAVVQETFIPVTARVEDTCAIVIAPQRVPFTNVVLGASKRQNVLVANAGVDTCRIERLGVLPGAPQFTLIDPPALPLSLGPGASSTLVVRYAPAMANAVDDHGTLEIATAGASRRADLVGNPSQTPGCHVELSSSFLNFGALPPTRNTILSVEVRNISSVACRLLDARLDAGSDPAFTNVQFTPTSLNPAEVTTIAVNYRAPSAGNASGTALVITDDADSPEHRVSLFGAVAAPNVCVEPRLLDYGAVTTDRRTFRVTACGALPVTVTDIIFTRPDLEFSLFNPPALPFVLNPGESQTVSVLYESGDAIGDSGIVSLGTTDPASPQVDVSLIAGPVIVPPTAGRYLYFWYIDSFGPAQSNIMRMPLQGAPVLEPFWGPLAGKGCAGCHGASPDGRYIAVVESDSSFGLTVVDTQTDTEVVLPFQVQNTAFFTWKPDVNSNPPYQFAWDDGYVVQLGSVVAGYLGELQGANDRAYAQKMPSWGANGKIAFVRGSAGSGGGWSFFGPTDIMIVDETGGVAQALNGASANGGANYYPAYHPSGDWIAYNYSAQASGTLSASDAVIRAVPTNQSGVVLNLPNLNAPTGASSFSTWSIDGSYLSFSSNRQGSLGSWDLYIAPFDNATGQDGAALNIIEANSSNFEHAARWTQ